MAKTSPIRITEEVYRLLVRRKLQHLEAGQRLTFSEVIEHALSVTPRGERPSSPSNRQVDVCAGSDNPVR